MWTFANNLFFFESQTSIKFPRATMPPSRHRFSIRTKAGGIAGRIFGGLFGLAFATFGIFFLWMASISPYLDQAKTDEWVEVPATILESKVERNGEELTNIIRFRYQYEDLVNESDKPYWKAPNLSYLEVQKVRDQLPPGTETVAFVNPAAPRQAVLFLNHTSSLWTGLFCLPFILIGLGVAGFSLFGKSKKKKAKGFSNRSPRRKKGKRNLVLSVFGLPFLGMGLFFCWIGGLSPILQSQAAENWPQVPCTITKSYVESHSDSDGTTYSVEIRFTYERNGKTYFGENYTFGNMSSSGRASKAAIVRKYPEGSSQICFVNPTDPYDAVITTEVGWLPWGIIGFSSIFILVGAGLFIGGFYRKNDPGPEAVFGDDEEEQSAEILELSPTTSRLARTVGSVFFTVLWNGISSIPWFIYFNERKTGNGDAILLIVGGIFSLVGLFLIGKSAQALLTLRNPKPRVLIAPGKITPGTKLYLSWKLEGKTSRLNSLEVYLEGTEIAQYQQGTNTVTDRNLFFQEQLFQTQERGSYREGSAEYEVPLATVPSMKSEHNEILWEVIFTGRIARWPDLKETYRLPVLPAKS